MADEFAQQRALENFLRRSLAATPPTKTRAEIEALAVEAFARMNDGTTIIETVIEGGTTRALVNCAPHVLLAACETILAETDPANPVGTRAPIYADFSGGRIET